MCMFLYSVRAPVYFYVGLNVYVSIQVCVHLWYFYVGMNVYVSI